MDGNPSKVIHQFMNSGYTEYWSYLLSKTEEVEMKVDQLQVYYESRKSLTSFQTDMYWSQMGKECRTQAIVILAWLGFPAILLQMQIILNTQILLIKWHKKFPSHFNILVNNGDMIIIHSFHKGIKSYSINFSSIWKCAILTNPHCLKMQFLPSSN
jgi:hypothetical protein